MGVKISQLPLLQTGEAASDDYLAIVDSSDGLLKRMDIDHASLSPAFGLGTSTKYGHLKVSDNYETVEGGADEGIAASQIAVHNSFLNITSSCLRSWVGTTEEWFDLEEEIRNTYDIIYFIDV